MTSKHRRIVSIPLVIFLGLCCACLLVSILVPRDLRFDDMDFSAAMKRLSEAPPSPLYVTAANGLAAEAVAGRRFMTVMSFSLPMSDVLSIADAFSMERYDGPAGVDQICRPIMNNGTGLPTWFKQWQASEVTVSGMAAGGNDAIYFVGKKEANENVRVFLRLEIVGRKEGHIDFKKSTSWVYIQSEINGDRYEWRFLKGFKEESQRRG